jgi:protein-tyrosine phosphatase
LLRDDPNGKVFVHCRVGADRTGVMVALYRLTFSHWSMAQTLAEMRAFHYHHIWLPHLQRYVESFPATMASDRDLSQFGPPAPTRAPNSSN